MTRQMKISIAEVCVGAAEILREEESELVNGAAVDWLKEELRKKAAAGNVDLVDLALLMMEDTILQQYGIRAFGKVAGAN
jgi:hypothetical protein